MRTDHRMMLAALLSAVSLGTATAVTQPTPDCRRATTAAERAICADPRLAAADAAMARAYRALVQAIPPAQQAALRADQREWIVARDGACTGSNGDKLAACLAAETEKRRRFLAGEGANGAAGAPPLLPTFLAENRPARYQITVAYPQFPAPVGAAFNRAARTLTIADKLLSSYRQAKPPPVAGAQNFYEVSYNVTYLDRQLAAVTFQFDAFAGGAHPNGWRSALLFDLRRDQPLTFAEFLAEPKMAVPAVAALCKEQLSAEAKRDGWELFDDADFAAVAGELKNWAVDKDGVTILFDAYSVAPYVVGPHECRLAWADLGRWLKPGGPLPPR